MLRAFIMRLSNIIFALAALLPLAACGSDDTGAESDDLSQAGRQLIGEYLERGAGAFRGLVLTNESVTSSSNRFFADIDTGIVCITTPCPTQERVEGTFSAGAQYIRLKSDTASELVQQYLGRYKYTFSGGKLSLSRDGFDQSLEAVDSYCSADSAEEDCGVTAGDLVHVECVGSWSCSAESTCAWDCSTGRGCGGLAGLTCADDEFCDYETDAFCGAADQMGVCKPRPTSCAVGCPAPEYQPCGCDGQSYCSECDANKNGVDVSGQSGTCGGEPKSCGGFAGFTCADDEYCDYEPSQMCGAGDQMGKCLPRPTSCPLGCPAPQYQPCGCDGQSYCSECDAQKAGVDVSEGSCG